MYDHSHLVLLIGMINVVSMVCLIPEQSVLVAGSTGYIGRSVVKELVKRDIPTIALVRTKELPQSTNEMLLGSTVIECNDFQLENLQRIYQKFQPACTICCLASRSGTYKDAWAVDYCASSNIFKAQETVSNPIDLKHFVLLSAFCVGKPKLHFQRAKLALEAEIRKSTLLSHSIVRPTAFMKSVDGQFENIAKGFPTIYFDKGEAAANPISAADLAEFLVTCAINPSQLAMINETRNLGGPGIALSKLQQLQLMYSILDIPEKNRLSLSIPSSLLTLLERASAFLSKSSSFMGFLKYGEIFDDVSEIMRILKYYAQEDMVTEKQNEKYGKVSIQDHFQSIKGNGGLLQEIDPMTTTTGVFQLLVNNQLNSNGTIYYRAEEASP